MGCSAAPAQTIRKMNTQKRRREKRPRNVIAACPSPMIGRIGTLRKSKPVATGTAAQATGSQRHAPSPARAK